MYVLTNYTFVIQYFEDWHISQERGLAGLQDAAFLSENNAEMKKIWQFEKNMTWTNFVQRGTHTCMKSDRYPQLSAMQ
jgi:hypothetical protein